MPVIPRKIDFPVDKIRRYLEPGPVVLVSSFLDGQTNIMTMGWHTVMEFAPSLIGCVIAGSNHSHEMIRKSGECVINVPSVSLLDKTIQIGNCTGAEMDKFDAFSLTPKRASKVAAPLIGECHANFECRLYDDSFIKKYDFFVFEVVKAHAAVRPKYPKTFHYTGDGTFMLSGEIVRRKGLFKAEKL